jgi:hypothetical protein
VSYVIEARACHFKLRDLVCVPLAASTLAMALVGTASAGSAHLPAIRLSATNKVPACVTPARLMAFLRTRNRHLAPRFGSIARIYRAHGKTWQVRWDYAFFQMIIETNFLTYRAPGGRWGDVDPKQNNFAGIGTTGGGVPGNRFPDVSTGVLAQMQHLVVYSGSPVKNPIAARTRLKQDVIIDSTRSIARRRPVTFQDLSGRWAVDRKYGRSIEQVARIFRDRYCNGADKTIVARKHKPEAPARQAVAKKQLRLTMAAPRNANRSASAARPVEVCKVQVAGPQGSETLLIRSREGSTVNLTALDVLPGQKDRMKDTFISSYAKGGRTIATYRSRAEAVNEARTMCRQLTSAG